MLCFRTLQQSIAVGKSLKNVTSLVKCNIVSYVQGQSPEPGIREYFYYIDHQGMLFLDDTRMKNFTSCFKDKKFLRFFFSRLRKNTTKNYADSFPYISLCGKERNFIRCDDLPIVFTHVLQLNDPESGETTDYFCYGHAGDLLKVPFEPNKVIMDPNSGRVYHPASKAVGGIGLVKSSLAIEFSTMYKFENGEDQSPTQFLWRGKWYTIDDNWYKALRRDTKSQ